MPELPEVETLCRQLNTVLQGQEILRIDIMDPRLGSVERKRGGSGKVIPGTFTRKVAELIGQRVAAVTRRGKYIQLQMNGGMTVELHLRMSGRLLYLAADKPLSPSIVPYCRLTIGLSAGILLLIDPRRFATFAVQPDKIAPVLPDDPLEGLPARRLLEIARTRRMPVKSFLMDQRLVAGIGNIYACEILFAAGIDPRRPVCNLTTVEWRKVSKAAKAILCRAVACRGTTVSDWRDLFGCIGTNQNHLEVYSRQAEPCRRCGGSIQRITLGGRGTWFCPICQK